MKFSKYVLMGKNKKDGRIYPLLIDTSFRKIEILSLSNVCSYFNSIKEVNKILKKIREQDNSSYEFISIGTMVMEKYK